MIVGIPGNLGAGKSATMAKMAQHYHSLCSVCNGIIDHKGIIPMIFEEDHSPGDCTCEKPKPHMIHANFWLNFDFHYVTSIEDIEKIYNGYAFLDEFWSWIDSRQSGYSETNIVVTGILHKSRKRGFSIFYESKLIHMTDRRIRELTDYILIPNKYIAIEGQLTKIDTNILYPVNLEAYINDTWFIIDLIDASGEFAIDEGVFQFPLTDVIGLYDTKEEIVNLADGENRPGLEKGMKIEHNFGAKIASIRSDSEIVHSKLSRGWDLVAKLPERTMAFDVVSVRPPQKRGSKYPGIDLRGKKIKQMLKTAEKKKYNPYWAYFYEGEWYVMPMMESHTIKTVLNCREAVTIESVIKESEKA